MKITIEIPEKEFNTLDKFIGERYIHPVNKKTLEEIRMFVATILCRLGIERYEGFDKIDFYDFMQNKIAKKFNLKKRKDF